MIPKADAKKHAEAEHAAAAKALEEKVDGAIRRGGATPIFIDIAGVPRAAVDLVKSKFQHGGWTVEESHDQRDGSALVLR
jgi:hypothetical protein